MTQGTIDTEVSRPEGDPAELKTGANRWAAG
jgi:hypothetical protein